MNINTHKIDLLRRVQAIMQGSASSLSLSPSSSLSLLFQDFRKNVHAVKPPREKYKHDPKHRLNRKTGNTGNSRTTDSVYGGEVQSKLNKVSPLLQGIIAFMCMSLLQSIGKGCDGGEGGGKHQHPMKSFLRELVKYCAYGKLHTAKKYEHYATLTGIGEEYCPNWSNTYNSEYIILQKVARRESFQELIDLLSEPGSIYELPDSDMEKIVDGFVCMSALPDSVFQGCFDRTGGTLPPDHCLHREPSESTTQTPSSFYIELRHALEKAVETLWSGKSHEESVIISNDGRHGMGRDSYFNIIDIYF